MIQTTEDITRIIEQDNITLTSKMLKSLITEHRAKEGKHQRELWLRYTMEDAPIMHREAADYEKVDRKIANDFFADVVDTKTGYMGNEVSVALEDESEKNKMFLTDWQRDSNSEDLNSEMVGLAGASGIGYRLLYVMRDSGEASLKNLFPWEVIYIYDQSIDVPQVAIRYYIIKGEEFGAMDSYKDYTVVEWYDGKGITYYIDDGNLEFNIDQSRGDSGYQPHLFKGIPIIPFPNNSLMKAEPEKALTLIDGYDAIMSSTTSEIEQLRMAYMFVKGAGTLIDKEFVKTLEQTGIFGLDENGEVGFVDKQLADAPVHNILAEIRRNIYQFSKSIDMSKDFGGEMRVIGWQIALLNLENSCKVTERKFIRALRRQYALLSDFWREFMKADIDPTKLTFTFTRNFPRDIQSEAETLNSLLTAVSRETAYGQMSFIDDPKAEIERMDSEASPYREDLNGNTEPTDQPQGD